MRDRHKERKRRKAGGNSCHEERDWQHLKGRKKEEWKRLDALCAVFSPPPPLPQPSLLAVDDWGAAAVGQSVGGGWKGGWQSLQQLWSSRDDRQGAPPHAPVFKSTADDDSGGAWAVTVPHISSPSPIVQWCGDGYPVSALLAFVLQLPKHSTCASAQLPFPFSLPPFSHSVPSISLLSILPAAASSKRLKLRRCSKYFPSSPSLSPRLLATTTLRLLTRKVCRACASFCWLAWYIVFFPVHTGKGGGRTASHPSFIFFFLKEKMRW